jgi:hypothetical protein
MVLREEVFLLLDLFGILNCLLRVFWNGVLVWGGLALGWKLSFTTWL